MSYRIFKVHSYCILPHHDDCRDIAKRVKADIEVLRTILGPEPKGTQLLLAGGTGPTGEEYRIVCKYNPKVTGASAYAGQCYLATMAMTTAETARNTLGYLNAYRAKKKIGPAIDHIPVPARAGGYDAEFFMGLPESAKGM